MLPLPRKKQKRSPENPGYVSLNNSDDWIKPNG